MRVGALRTRITVEAPANAQNAYGEVTKTWSTFATRWAQKRITGGREGELAGGIREQATVEFVLRRLSGITTQMRVNEGGTLYNILHVAEDQWRRTTRILARLVA